MSRAPWQDQDNNNQAAYGRFSFGSEERMTADACQNITAP